MKERLLGLDLGDSSLGIAVSDSLGIIHTRKTFFFPSKHFNQAMKEVDKLLKEEGFKKYIIAGGETSGQVTKALKVKGFYIGPTIAPGVPWVKAVNENISLALKSGNFGEIDFFNQAQGKF